MITAVLLSFAAVASPQQTEPQASAQEAPRHMGRAYLFEVDVEAGRRLGWISADVPREEALELVRASLHSRLRNSGKFVEARPVLEADGRISVTFVGRMAKGIEDMLSLGLSRPGRLEAAVVATDADLEGTTIARERERLDAWLAANTSEGGAGPDLSRFAGLGREEGGPSAALRWTPMLEAPSTYVPILESATRLIRREEIERMGLERIEAEDRKRASWELALIPGDALRGELEEMKARKDVERCYLVDGRAVLPASLELVSDALRVSFPRGLEDLRSFALSFAGEPPCAPVRFTGFEKRPLEHVVIHVPGDDD